MAKVRNGQSQASIFTFKPFAEFVLHIQMSLHKDQCQKAVGHRPCSMLVLSMLEFAISRTSLSQYSSNTCISAVLHSSTLGSSHASFSSSFLVCSSCVSSTIQTCMSITAASTYDRCVTTASGLQSRPNRHIATYNSSFHWIIQLPSQQNVSFLKDLLTRGAEMSPLK